MKRFVPKNKLGKKARRQLDRQQRVFWPICPVTRSVESRKIYNRHRKTRDYQEDWIRGFSFSQKAYFYDSQSKI